MSSDGSTVLFGALPSRYRFTAPEKRRLTLFARKLAATVGAGRNFDCLLTSDGELKRLNRTFLQHDYATDVLSFPSGDGASRMGECAISVERAGVQSRKFGHSMVDEIQILMLHGALHLTGLDHEKDAGAMARAEQHWRSEFRLPTSLIERSLSPLAASSLKSGNSAV